MCLKARQSPLWGLFTIRAYAVVHNIKYDNVLWINNIQHKEIPLNLFLIIFK